MTVESSVGVFNHTLFLAESWQHQGINTKPLTSYWPKHRHFRAFSVDITQSYADTLLGREKAKATVLTMPKIYRVLMGS
ncbi:hypothetical protein [Providencia sp. PROV099]|uniref:hypothetical protein n=1 Tax=Providencia sp. PROV099 TaxID=2949815 RepID=UPI00293440DB|nr:hypothetical protein [Providencia sp. PROV099]WOB94642.1 hypothetical protein P3L54_17795 [Providencia sp. PROV099]